MRPEFPALALERRVQQIQHALKQADVVLVRNVMVPVARTQLGVTIYRDIGRSMGQRLHQSHANHIGCVAVAWHGPAHVPHGILDTARDDGGRVKQRAIPVKSNQVELAWSWRIRVQKVWHGS